MSRRLLGGLSLGLSLAIASCSGPPPVRDFEHAKESFDNAVAARAEHLAPELFHAALEARTVLEAEIKVQSGKRFKSYDEATELAVAAQAAADKALAEAMTVAQRTLARAKSGNDEGARGPEVLANGDFAAGLDAWGRNPSSDATVSVEQTGPNQHTWHVQYRKGNWVVINQTQRLKPNTVYVYEAWVKTTAPVVALYWQSDVGRHYQEGSTYAEWTHLRYEFLTPSWMDGPFPTDFCPLLMKAPGDAWLRDVRVWEFTGR